MNKKYKINTRATSWMRQLAFHYEYIKRSYPEDRLMIVFDIDGTILDTRHAVKSVLKAYDREHDTAFFSALSPEMIPFKTDDLLPILDDLHIPAHEHHGIMLWCIENL